MPMHSTQAKAKSALLLTAFIWGSTFFVMKEAAAVFPPALLMAVRFTVGAAAGEGTAGERFMTAGDAHSPPAPTGSWSCPICSATHW